MRQLAAAGLVVVFAAGCGKKPDPAPAASPAPQTPGANAPGSPGAPPSERDKLVAAVRARRGDPQRDAADKLAELADKDPAALDALVELLRDKTTAGAGKTSPGVVGSVREAAAVALLRAGPKGEAALKDKGLTALREGLKDRDAAVREHTAYTLGVLGRLAKPAAAAVLGLCSDPDPLVRDAAFDAVTAIGSPDVPALAALLNHSNGDVRRRAAEVVGVLPQIPPGAAPSLTLALLSDDQEVRQAAASGLAAARLKDPPAKTAENLAAAIRKGYPDQPPDEEDEVRLDGPEAAYWRALAKCGKAGVTPTAELLTHPNLVVRTLAARTLADLGPEAKAAVPALDRALNDPSANVSLEVACTLTRLGERSEAVTGLVKAALASTSPGVAAAAVRAIGQMGPAGAALAPLAVEKLGSLQADARHAAVGFVGKLPPAEGVKHLPTLTRLVADREGWVRRRVGRVLEGWGPAASPAAEAVGRRLAAEDDAVAREQWVDALAAMGPGAKPAVGPLLAVAAEPDAGASLRSRAVAAAAVADPGSPAVAAGLVKAAGDADLAVRMAAALALGRLDPLPDDAVATLVKMARADPRAESRMAAVRGLAAAGPRAKAARPELETIAAGGMPGLDLWAKVAVAAVDGDPGAAAGAARAGLGHAGAGVRTAAAQALAIVGPTAADVPALIKLTREPSGAAKEAAAVALGRVGPEAKEAVPRLVVLLGAREADVRAAAAEALGRVGPDATPALPKLKAALKDPSVAAAARRAIEKIGGGDGGPG